MFVESSKIKILYILLHVAYSYISFVPCELYSKRILGGEEQAVVNFFQSYINVFLLVVGLREKSGKVIMYVQLKNF